MENRKPKVLFINGSMNQTTQMYKIYLSMQEHIDGYFTQFFPDNLIHKLVVHLGLLDKTIIAGKFREHSERFVRDHGLQYDYGGRKHFHEYDLVFLCTDAMVPNVARRTKSIFIQEGMTDPIDTWARWVKRLKLPAYAAMRTSLNGTMNAADVYCVASEGYKKQFSQWGTDERRIVVTGMPNFDHCESYLNNDFPYKDFVLVCTSDIRETMKTEDRVGFIKQASSIAAGRPMIFKLHPNEIWDRAYKEIMVHAPEGTMVFQKENTNHMIANCSELICQFSTVVYVGMSLGKKVHSYFDYDELKQLLPIQNGGLSASNIGELALRFISHKGSGIDFCESLNSRHIGVE
jgi:hypothetical protein